MSSAKIETPKSESSIINWRVDSWFKDLSTKQLSTLKSYCELLYKHNKTLNLVSPKTLPLSDALHFSDSILAMQALYNDAPNIDKLHCLLSGSGFPFIVAATLNQNIRVVMIDPDQKKCDFLKGACSDLGLSNTEIKCSGLDNLAESSIKYAVTRNAFNISKVILAARKCVAPKGILYHMKGEQWSLEVGEIPTQLCSVWEPSLVREYKLPIGEVRFALLKTTKI